MMTLHRTAVVAALSLCTFASTYADDAPAAAQIEKHKVGKYAIDVPGTPIKPWLEFNLAMGGTVKDAALARKIASGEVKWLSREEGKGERYQVIVPDSYKPGVPHGVLVFVNAGDSGVLPNTYHPLLSKHRLIAIGADDSGNKRDVVVRHALAVGAVDVIRDRYDVDDDRVYITGGSGGGRVTSHVMIMRADLFDGGIPWIGANPCMPMQNADSKGNTFRDPGSWRKPDQRILREAGVNGRYVFMTGSKDYNKPNVKAVYEGYKGNGFKHVEYIEQEGLGHATPSAENYEKAIVFLDAPLREDAAKHFEQAKRMDGAGRKDEALGLYRKAAAHGGDAEWRPEAAAKAAELQSAYDADVKTIEDAIAAQDRAAFQKALGEFRKNWRSLADRDRMKDFADRFIAAGQTEGSK